MIIPRLAWRWSNKFKYNTWQLLVDILGWWHVYSCYILAPCHLKVKYSLNNNISQKNLQEIMEGPINIFNNPRTQIWRDLNWFPNQAYQGTTSVIISHLSSRLSMKSCCNLFTKRRTKYYPREIWFNTVIFYKKCSEGM